MKTLNGWKEIAVYMQCSVRTVQRWERTEGLPVIRHRNQQRGTVRALPSRLDDWQRRQTISVTERIRGELGRQLGEMHKLNRRQRELVEALQKALTDSREIYAQGQQLRQQGPTLVVRSRA
jgi:phage terminase Nu1 subunit (DNA packaging protein)